MNTKGTDILDKDNRIQISRCLKKYAPYIYSSGLAQSRRIEGQFRNRREIRAYEKVFMYMQQGLGNRTDLLKAVVKRVMYFQKNQMLDSYPLYIYTFGKSGNDFKREMKITGRRNSNPLRVVRHLAEKLGDKPADSAVIPSLLKPKCKNLVVFVCNNKNVKMDSDAFARYSKALKKNSTLGFC